MIVYCSCPFMFAALLGSLCRLTLLSFPVLVQINRWLSVIRLNSFCSYSIDSVQPGLFAVLESQSLSGFVTFSQQSIRLSHSKFRPKNSDSKFRSVVTGSSCPISLASSVVENENWLRPIF